MVFMKEESTLINEEIIVAADATLHKKKMIVGKAFKHLFSNYSPFKNHKISLTTRFC